MKKLSFLLVFLCLALTAVGQTSVADPTGVMDQIIQLNDEHAANVDALMDGIQVDWHPRYGSVEADAYPVGDEPMTFELAESMFRDEIGNAEILDFSITENTFSGRTLMEHSINGEQIFVWHDYDQVPAFIGRAFIMINGRCYILVRVWIQTCTNGAGYWSNRWIRVPCFFGWRWMDYTVGGGILTDRVLDVMQPEPLDIDPTGVLQRLNDMNTAHAENIEGILGGVAVDEHPEYGFIGTDDFPVDESGIDPDEAHAWLEEQTAGMNVLSMEVNEFQLAGRTLVEHMVDGQLTAVWHDLQGVPALEGRAIAVGPDGYCYMWRRVWIQTCTNGAGYWRWYRIRIPCNLTTVSFDYYHRALPIRALGEIGR